MNKLFASYFFLFASYFFNEFRELPNDEKIKQQSIFQRDNNSISFFQEKFASYLLVTC